MPCAGVRQRGSAQLCTAYKNARVDICSKKKDK